MTNTQTTKKASLKIRIVIAMLSIFVPIIATVATQGTFTATIHTNFTNTCLTFPCFSGAGAVVPPVEGVPTNINVSQFTLKVISFFLDFVLILAVLMLVIAGVYLIVSLGDDGNKEKAKKIVIYVVAGILLILFARAIVVYVNNFFTP